MLPTIYFSKKARCASKNPAGNSQFLKVSLIRPWRLCTRAVLLLALLGERLPCGAQNDCVTGFAEAINYTVGNARSMATADFNGDGLPDLAVATSNHRSVTVLQNNNGSGFLQKYSTIDHYPRLITTGDFNGDGKTDLLVTEANSDEVSVLLNNGSSSFSAATKQSLGVVPSFITTADFNADGRADLVVRDAYGILVFLNNGTGGFFAPAKYLEGSISVTTADFNEDGKTDLAIKNSSNNISVLLNNGSGGFLVTTSYPAGPGHLVAADFNGDGKTDLATLANSYLLVLLNNGAGFGEAVNYPIGNVSAFSVAAADLNGDGRADLAIAGFSSASVLLSNSSGGFFATMSYPLRDDNRTIVTADLNGDGKEDLAMANEISQRVSVLLNTCIPDSDGDEVADVIDNCTDIANTAQTDTDGDGQGDACDTDDDNDGVLDANDNCPLIAGVSQTDTDGDGQGDACDNDDDNDGIPDTNDNCPLASNASQTDTDGDGQGDACDTDDDNDGLPDTMDNCPLIANSSQTDSDGDGQGDACDSDDDNDGTPDNDDCAPLNPDIHPGATEICGNGIDENCNGMADDVCVQPDTDKDGDPDVTDCAPLNPAIHHGATEVYNGKDDDCDGEVDEGLTITWYKDNDGDGYGNKYQAKKASVKPKGYVSNCHDCCDYDKTIYPGAPELCDNKDNDCDGKTDEGLSKKAYYKDQDKDGYGDPKQCVTTCDKCPKGYVTNNRDWNDKDKTIYPGAPELCDGKDNDGDKQVDEGFTKKTYYKDHDGDGYGDLMQSITTCEKCPSGYVTNSRDCNDRNKKINPGAKEIPGNKCDDNCNSKVDEKPASRGVDEELIGEELEDMLTANEVLKVSVLPNPSPNYFTLNIRGSSDKPVELRVMDISGKLVEVQGNLRVNNTVAIGHRYRPGVYFVEMMQGSERRVIRCIKE